MLFAGCTIAQRPLGLRFPGIVLFVFLCKNNLLSRGFLFVLFFCFGFLPIDGGYLILDYLRKQLVTPPFQISALIIQYPA